MSAAETLALAAEARERRQVIHYPGVNSYHEPEEIEALIDAGIEWPITAPLTIAPRPTSRTPWPTRKQQPECEMPSGVRVDVFGTIAILMLLLTISGLFMGWWG